MAYADKEKERAMRRKNYYKNLEESRAKHRAKKRRKRLRAAKRINEYQRDWYARNRASEARKQNSRRIARAPYIGLRTAIRDCERGNISIAELIERLGRSLAAGAEINPTSRGIGPRDGGILSPNDAPIIKKHLRHSPNENDGD